MSSSWTFENLYVRLVTYHFAYILKVDITNGSSFVFLSLRKMVDGVYSLL